MYLQDTETERNFPKHQLSLNNSKWRQLFIWTQRLIMNCENFYDMSITPYWINYWVFAQLCMSFWKLANNVSQPLHPWKRTCASHRQETFISIGKRDTFNKTKADLSWRLGSKKKHDNFQTSNDEKSHWAIINQYLNSITHINYNKNKLLKSKSKSYTLIAQHELTKDNQAVTSGLD